MSSAEIVRTSEGVPPGWMKTVSMRRSGATVGRVDIYILSPSGQKFRSKVELRKYLEMSSSQYTVDDFDMSRKSVPQNVVKAALQEENSPAKASPMKRKPSSTPKPLAASTPRLNSASLRREKRLKLEVTPTPIKPEVSVVVKEQHVDKKDLKQKSKPCPLSVKLAKKATPKRSATDETAKRSSKETKNANNALVRSPINSMLERFAVEGNEWKFVIAALFQQFHNDFVTKEVEEQVAKFFESFSCPEAVAIASSWVQVEGFLGALSEAYRNERAEVLARSIAMFSFHYCVNWDESIMGRPNPTPVDVDQLPGTNDYVRSCYKVFIRRDFELSADDENSNDVCCDAAFYRQWIRNHQQVQEQVMNGHDNPTNVVRQPTEM